LKIPLKTLNEMKVLAVFKDHPEYGFNQALKESEMHRKTFNNALKRLQKRGVIHPEPSGRKKKYVVDFTRELTRFYLIENGKYFHLESVTLQQIKNVEQIQSWNSAYGGIILQWGCKIHGQKNVVYALLPNGICAYCNEKGCSKSEIFLKRKKKIVPF
jgi:hypothetical protein